MYSGSTLKSFKYFDAWFGTHQKINRVARRHLETLFEGQGYYFPTLKQIHKFEGINGPDGIKRKKPSPDEPWHFYDPTDPEDNKLVDIIDGHYKTLVDSLKQGNHTRAAFEAAWLAHAIVDGLTPAHHYPYEEELTKLRSGQGIETRDSFKEKLFMHGDSMGQQLGNNWKMWGDKGLLATHFAFEWGVAIMVSPLRLRLGRPDETDRVMIRQGSIGELFKLRAAQVAELGMYEMFYKSGWTPKLAKQVRRQLAPLIVNAVTLAWYSAVLDAKQTPEARLKRRTA